MGAGGAEGWQGNSRIVSQIGLQGLTPLAIGRRPVGALCEHYAAALSPRWGFGFLTIGLQGLTPLAID